MRKWKVGRGLRTLVFVIENRTTSLLLAGLIDLMTLY